MPRDKDFKRIVRARMQKTGESYTTARAHITQKQPRSRTGAGLDTAASSAPDTAPKAAAAEPVAAGKAKHATGSPAATPAPDLAALAGMSDGRIAEKTGHTWQQWVEELDARGMQQSQHGDIARLVNEHYGVDSWWSQSVTVGYERIKGLREKGQRRSGSYEVNKSKTVHAPVAALFDACVDDAARRRWLTGANPQVTTAAKPKSARLRFEDGTIVAFGFVAKGPDRSAVAIQHMKLTDRATADRLKTFWGERLDALARLLNR